ncbi:putative (di)nucleoside polyphosphate hydrolase [Rhizobium leguminosarum]|uniref:RNA pyrophosphohydrolase n=1 Tax=Rhizobium leguminosarum TaxID=384 RepID=A0AAE2ML64_RHILE|nr:MULTISPECIES: RNA pyrophosphohydrolase [Rhizobium]MBB4291633.1 putative (di)nucleoside polyphosphate hydrolase [Rhizobium leguminosarum]MBB4298233.1 putative (di)nucleoside polyphosphate hydrolase [Rhizobium leguminosarum]MBB4309371.1 putative (di)nucleoside polyphosphate hydrolase [Rhizobium leguminosarum]MBB4418808.1 putative (di)nucleoside polyphosphate hydrolase [Rhizobium leguminosarum]MBB4433861.1 putative (di)nucleoside polyphosphate hydrolase [Rhizobium esperanzae]
MSQTTVEAEDLPYRPCVGVMILNRDGLVWAGRRIPDGNSEYDGSPQLWQMPQGGIDKGEDPLDAAYRELYEETGIKTVTLLAEARNWINYDLPPALIGIGLKGKFRGQTQRWFAFRFEGNDSEIAINPPPGGHEPEFDAWEWKPMRELPGLIVPFKRAVYDQVIAEFEHLAALQSED